MRKKVLAVRWAAYNSAGRTNLLPTGLENGVRNIGVGLRPVKVFTLLPLTGMSRAFPAGWHRSGLECRLLAAAATVRYSTEKQRRKPIPLPRSLGSALPR
jgi:hypothetical protein